MNKEMKTLKFKDPRNNKWNESKGTEQYGMGGQDRKGKEN